MTKLEKLKQEFLKGNFKKSISIASKFPRLGDEKDIIKLAQDCITNPSFYKQLGYDIEKIIDDAIYAIEKKYNIGGQNNEYI